jgi:hypothetical protein
VAAISFASDADAALVTWEVAGHVSVINGDPSAISAVGGSAALGDSFTIQYSFDPALASIGTHFSPTFVDWEFAVQYTTFQIGSWSREIFPTTFATSSNSHISVASDDPNVGFVYSASVEQWFDGHPHGSGIIAGWFFQASDDGGSSLGSSTDIPIAPFDLGAFTMLNGPQMQVSVNARPGLSGNVLGTVDTIRIVPNPVFGVPEPGTWILMLLGVGGVGGAMRSRPRLAAA